MENNVSQVKQEKQQENSLVKLIVAEMTRRGWDYDRLADEAKVARSSVWRLMPNKEKTKKKKGSGQFKLDSLVKLLDTLEIKIVPESERNHNIIPFNHAKYDPGNAHLHDALEYILKDTDARKTIEKVLRGLMSDIKGELEQRQDIKEIKLLLRRLVEREP